MNGEAYTASDVLRDASRWRLTCNENMNGAAREAVDEWLTICAARIWWHIMITTEPKRIGWEGIK